ncbi:MAG: metalloregulator ArsR/SmtB family transcription factor [Clostridiales bacterium]|nr:metalloregulator ArsR/SmtB family transcription factor [Clostridiales bacterium]MCF8023712.1 metalloregulator ArsR/SmtB family transcription factor [Clostridiales bacterium]
MTLESSVKISKALGESTRLKIIKLLSVRPMYVCELESVLKISQPRISQHLRIIKEAGLVKERKEAQRVFYMLQTDYLQSHLKKLINFLDEDLENLPEFEEENSRLQKLQCDSNVVNCKNIYENN